MFPGTLAILNVEVPLDLLHCYRSFTNLTTGDTIGEPIHVHCLQEFLLKKDIVPWHEFDMTQKDFDFLNTLTRTVSRDPGASINGIITRHFSCNTEKT